MKLLTVDEVLKLWRCHRVTLLRLMKRGTLHWVEEDGELLFEEAEVTRLKNARIGIFPHLTISRGDSRQPQPRRPLPDQLVWDYHRMDEKFARLTQEARWLAVEAELCLVRSRQVRSDFERARDASWAGPHDDEVNLASWSISLVEAGSEIAEALLPPQ